MCLVLLEFFSHYGTSKKTNMAQNLTPSYIFWDGIVFTKTEQLVI